MVRTQPPGGSSLARPGWRGGAGHLRFRRWLQVLFRKALKDKLEDFEEPNVLRILRRHIINYIQIQELQKVRHHGPWLVGH